MAGSFGIVLHFGQVTSIHQDPGCYYSNCCGRELRYISKTQRGYDLTKQKILDRNGNPLSVSAVITYRFDDPGSALLRVQNANDYVINQAAASLKNVVGKFTYDELKVEASHIGDEMIKVLQPKVHVAGAVISSVTLNELQYAPEIPGAMLKKQQAAALVEARHLIVQGACEICDNALKTFESKGILLSHEEKVKIITNLLTVTTSDRDTTPTLAM